MGVIGRATIYVFSLSTSLFILGVYIVGTARYLTNVEDNTCDMTYMFEYPQYVRVALDDEIEERYPRFGLYAYGEGFLTQTLRRMKFSGIPVLFVPGNGGSHEQVRSLASVSLRKSIDDRTPFHFDYFTVSLGKDYSALYGGVLEEETSYVRHCTSRILSLYGGKVDKIVLIGHSMGGIIAKGALLRSHSEENPEDGNKNGSWASILVTMASPHKPIFLPDRKISRYYQELERSRHRFEEMETTIVSIGGGERDSLVGSSQTIFSSADLNVITSGIPDVWKSTDHLCILWCKQLVLTVVRALFDCVDKNARPPNIISDPRYKLRALSYHFTSRFSGKKFRGYDERREFERGAEWIEDIRRQYTWSTDNFRGSKNKTVFLMIRLDSPSYDALTLESVNFDAKDWLFACSAYAIQANSRVCEWGWNLTNRTSLLPDPMHRSRKKLNINIEDLRGSLNTTKLSHIVVRIPSSEFRGKKTPAKIHVDLYKTSDRTLHLENSAKVYPLGVGILTPNPYLTIDSSPRGCLAYRVDLSGIHDAVIIDIETINEDSKKNIKLDGRERAHAIFELFHRSNNHHYSSDQVRLLTFNRDGESGRKQQRTVMHLVGEKSMLTVNLGAEYSYRISIRRAGIIERVACLVRDRWPTLYPITIGLSLIVLATRIDNSYDKQAVVTCGVTIILAIIVDCIFETFVAIGLLHVFAVTTCCLVVFFGSVAHNVVTRFFARIAALPNSWFDWLLPGLDRLPIVTTFVLLSLISVTCGAIAILLSVGLIFLKLTKLYEECVEELLMASFRQFNPFARSRRKGNDNNDERKVNSAAAITTNTTESTKTRRELILDSLLVFVIWSLTAIPAIPSALVWAKNFRYETRLSTEEPTMLLSWVVLTGWASLGFHDIPPRSANGNDSSSSSSSASLELFTGSVLRLSGWVLLYTARLENSAHYQWIVPPLVALCITLLALLSLFSPAGRVRADGGNSRI